MKAFSSSGWVLALCIFILASCGPTPATRKYPFRFRDVSEKAGIYPHIAGVRAHAGLWGDVDSDGWADYFVGTFYVPDTTKSLLLRNVGGRKFVPDTQEILRVPGRATGGAFADFDNDGDLDFYLSNNTHGDRGKFGGAASFLFRNDGGGRFTDVTETSGACPPFRARDIVVVDIDGDGLLDFLRAGGRLTRDERSGSRVFRNKGKLTFEDVTVSSGLPEGYGGSSGTAADVNNDTYPDILFAGRGSGNRLFLNDGKGHFTEAAGTYEVFSARFNDEARPSPCGPCFADVNRDGLVDLVIGQATKRPWDTPMAPRLYLNRGVKNGTVVFEDVTEAAGLVPLTMKCPHVEIQDFNNDGWPDIYCGMFKFAGGKIYPVIFKNLGIRDGLVRFREDAQAVNDFPTEEDRDMRGRTTPFYEKMVKDRKVTYAVAAPSGDYDRDGRLDLFVAEWWAESPSFLLRNETRGGRWLQVGVCGAAGVNRMGIGSKVKVYEAGKLGVPSALLGCRDIVIGYGYSSSHEAVAHFGLGRHSRCDVEVILPHRKGTIRRRHVKANQRLTVP